MITLTMLGKFPLSYNRACDGACLVRLDQSSVVICFARIRQRIDECHRLSEYNSLSIKEIQIPMKYQLKELSFRQHPLFGGAIRYNRSLYGYKCNIIVINLNPQQVP